MRVKIFIDFWNFQLSWNEYHQRKGAKGSCFIRRSDALVGPWLVKVSVF